MILICRAPKRFVAALKPSRIHSLKSSSATRVLFSTWVVQKPAEENFAARKVDGPITKLGVAGTTAPLEASIAATSELTGPRPQTWYTGIAPVPGSTPKSLPQFASTSTSTRKDVQAYFDNTWMLTEVLFSCLQGEEAFMIPPYHELRHPLIFYYGHAAAVYVNKLRCAGLLKDPINPYFEAIFETGVDEMSWDDLSKNKMAWPSVAQVHDYRRKVYQAISNIIGSLDDKACQNITAQSPYWALLMGMEHERIHIETSSVLMMELPLKYIRMASEVMPPYHPSIPAETNHNPVSGVDYPRNEMIAVAPKQVVLGKDESFPTFGWDNEYGRRVYDVAAFRGSKYKISNGEFLEFVRDSGYNQVKYWTAKGWEWRAFRNVKWPVFWILDGPHGSGRFKLRVLCDVVAMPWNWPVVVNYHEARAYAAWKSEKEGKKYRLMTELEHQAIRGAESVDISRSVESSVDPIAADGHHDSDANVNWKYSSMSPVNASKPNELGFHDVWGNAWEWKEDYFCPLPGFKVHPYYEDFSTPCFDGLHNIIQSCSFISTGNLASVYSRYHFRPHFTQHSSFRLVEAVDAADSDKVVTSDTDAPGPFVGVYPFRRSAKGAEERSTEVANLTEKTAFQSVLFKNFLTVNSNFGVLSAEKGAPLSGPKRLWQLLSDVAKKQNLDLKKCNLLEVGCSAGGFCFTAVDSLRSVVGVDHSLTAIATANRLLKGERLVCHFDSTDANKSSTGNEERVIEFPQSTTSPRNLSFRCADPMCLPAEMKDFDIVVASDVLDKMASPNALLGRLGGLRGLVRPGGLLVVTSAFEWSEDRTPRSLWLSSDGSAESSASALTERLRRDRFQPAAETTMLPFLWQESASSLRGKLLRAMIFIRA